jgi:hypothetical protein
MSNKITIESIENKISELYKIESWKDRIDEIKNIKKDIEKENSNIDNLLSSLDKPLNKVKEYNIDKILSTFNDVELSTKIKYYNYLSNHIKNIESELFM